MADVIADLLVKIGADISGMQKGFADAEASLANFGQQTTAAGVGLVKLGAPLTALGVLAANTAGDFEASMNILAVAAGHHKRTMFTIAERLEMAEEICRPYDNVQVMAFRGLLRDFVVGAGARVVVRGLRAVSDFEYEFQMAGMNRQLMPEVETVFMTPSDQFQFVSGTFVREIATLGGDVSKFVAPSVLSRLQERVSGTET